MPEPLLLVAMGYVSHYHSTKRKRDNTDNEQDKENKENEENNGESREYRELRECMGSNENNGYTNA